MGRSDRAEPALCLVQRAVDVELRRLVSDSPRRRRSWRSSNRSRETSSVNSSAERPTMSSGAQPRISAIRAVA